MAKNIDMRAWLAFRKDDLRRRWVVATRGRFDPFPPVPEGVQLSPSAAHRRQYAASSPALAWKAGLAPGEWQSSARAKLIELTGYRAGLARPRVLHVQEQGPPKPGYQRRTAFLRTADEIDIPVHLVWREPLAARPPAMLCLQGTNLGAHVSWGEPLMPLDHLKIASGYAYGLQAAERGYLAVCPEVSCFGARAERDIRPRSQDPCIDAANHALLTGRTLIGERVTDVSSVITWLEHNDIVEVDMARIHMIGHSSGGSISLFSAAIDTRIQRTTVSGAVGYFRETIAQRRDPAGQIVIPGILNWLEMDDVVRLIAPRSLLAVAGTKDHIWPYAGAANVVEAARPFFAALGVASALQVVRFDGGHTFRPAVAWPAFDRGLAGS